MDLKGNLTEATADLLSHKHKVVSVDFHPLANNLLVSTSGDLTAKLWDLSCNKDVITLKVLPHLSVTFQLIVSLKEKTRIKF
jgi:WD40 repeat protein